MAIRDKTTTNKWTYERSHISLNSYSLVEYNKIYLNTNSWKTLQEESLWQINFDNLYFWNTLNKTHQDIFVWNRNNRLHTNNKKHVSHERVGERKTYINNLPLWQFVTKPQQTNEHMREVINYLTHTHLLNTIKSIITQTLEKFCKKRVYGK